MSDAEMRKMLTAYVNEQMNQIIPDKMEGYDHTFSKKFNKKIKKLFWSEKYFGKKIQMGYAIRRAAMIAITLVSILVAGHVSAKIFGFRPWKYISSYMSDVKMEDKMYTKPSTAKKDAAKVVSDKPTYVPKGFKQTEQTKDSFNRYVLWTQSDKIGIQYSRSKIDEGTSISTDAEYTAKKGLQIAGYQAYLYTKQNQMWIIWDDTVYNHHIFCINTKNPEKELVAMAKSLY